MTIKKKKFELTSDIVTVEKEPYHLEAFQEARVKKKNTEKKEQLNLKIDTKIKKKFQIWCLNNNKTMSEVVEEYINSLIF